MKQCPKCGKSHPDYLLVCSLCDIKLQRIDKKYSDRPYSESSRVNQVEEDTPQNENNDLKEFLENLDDAPFENIWLALEEMDELYETIKEHFTIEKILLKSDFGPSDKCYLLEKLYDYDIEDATDLIKCAEKEFRDARLSDIKRKISQKAREMYGNIPTDDNRSPISDDVKMHVWQRDRGKCVKCGGNEKLEFDHIIPFSKGGSDTARNIQLLCEKCNRQKSGNIC